MVLQRVAQRIAALIRGLVRSIAPGRRGRQHGVEGGGDGELNEHTLESSGGADIIQSDDVAPGGGVDQEHCFKVSLEEYLAHMNLASAGSEESSLVHSAAPPVTPRSSVVATPGVLAHHSLAVASGSTPLSEALSLSMAMPQREATGDSDEETICTEADTVDMEGEEQDTDSGHFQQGSFSLSLSQMEMTKAYVGVVRTRFPPEPNGPLHLGHAKAIHINFSVARRYGGQCILRFDDTNPKTARQTYCKEALDMVRWLGYWPDHVSYSSDYFDDLILCMSLLIMEGAAFVCHQQQRGGSHDQEVMESPWRYRAPTENMKKFRKMCVGGYSEGQAVVRLKVRTRSGLRDPVAYRVCNSDHHRTGNRWCIYPTYDFSHPIIDSREGIAVSLCSDEFASHRSLYQWVQKKLDMHKVPQREFQRLQVRGCLLSKRQLAANLGTSFHTYDDPRLATLAGLRRRGTPPEAIRRFVREGYREYEQLLDISRELLLLQAKHCMVVLQPLPCRVINYDEVAAEEGMAGQPSVSLQVPECQAGPYSLGHHVTLSSVIFINKFDFHLRETRHYFTPSSAVHLRGTCYAMHFSSMARSKDGEVVSLQVVVKKVEGKVKSMKVLTWVSEPVLVTVNFLDSLSSNEHSSESPLPGMYSTQALMEATPLAALRIGPYFTYGQTLQAERFAYITLDSSSPSKDKLVFNVTCLLRLHPCLHASILKVFKPASTPAPYLA